MKKLFFNTAALLIMACSCYAQSSGKVDYRQKSKNQKTAAWVLLGVGVGLDVAGIITTASNANKEIGGIFDDKTSVNHTGEYVLYIAGTAALASGLTLFIAAKRNKTKAASVSFKNEMVPQLQSSMVFYKPIPALSLKISL